MRCSSTLARELKPQGGPSVGTKGSNGREMTKRSIRAAKPCLHAFRVRFGPSGSDKTLWAAARPDQRVTETASLRDAAAVGRDQADLLEPLRSTSSPVPPWYAFPTSALRLPHLSPHQCAGPCLDAKPHLVRRPNAARLPLPSEDGLGPPLRPPGRAWIRVDRGGKGRSTQQCPPRRSRPASAAPILGSGHSAQGSGSGSLGGFGDNRHGGARHRDDKFYCGKVNFQLTPQPPSPRRHDSDS